MAWQPLYDPAAEPGDDSRLLLFADGRVALAAGRPAGEALHVGSLDGAQVFAARAEGAAPEGARTLRELFAEGPDELAAAAGRAAQLLEWDATHRFCGRDGSPTERGGDELVRVCPVCGSTYYPRISPAVIMLVEREGRLLLARRAGAPRPRAMYSCLAGFVEPGETLEEAVAREVLEEVGVEVEDVRYVASQPWPFPSQLMVGFTARWAGGELRVDERELGDAQWWDPRDLPQVPPPYTIARTLIDGVVARLTG